MRIQIIVAANEIVSRGRTISRLKNTTHAGFWRRAASGTWFCTQVEGKRSAEGMTYTLDIVRTVDLAPPHKQRETLEMQSSADWGCLDGYSVIEPERRVRSRAADPADDSSDAAEPTDPSTAPGTDGGEPPEASADG